MQFFDQKLCCRGEGLVFSTDDKHFSLWNIFKGTEDDIASIFGMNKLIKHYGITYAGFCHNSAIIGKVHKGRKGGLFRTGRERLGGWPWIWKLSRR